jgi:hypothetical protein
VLSGQKGRTTASIPTDTLDRLTHGRLAATIYAALEGKSRPSLAIRLQLSRMRLTACRWASISFAAVLNWTIWWMNR